MPPAVPEALPAAFSRDHAMLPHPETAPFATDSSTSRGGPEVDRLAARVTRIEDETLRDRAAGRSLFVLVGAAAVLGFVATTLTWRLGHRVAGIDGVVRGAAALLEQSTADSRAAVQRVEGTLQRQAAFLDGLAATLADIETAGREVQARLAALDRHVERHADAAAVNGRQLTELAIELGRFRRETETRLAKQHDDLVAGRGEMLQTLTASVAQVEGVMLRQAEELRTQREDMHAATVQMRTRQQRILGEATDAIAAQLDGLRQIIDCLRDESATGAAVVAETVAAPAAVSTTVEPAETDAAAPGVAVEPAASATVEPETPRVIDTHADASPADAEPADAETADAVAPAADTPPAAQVAAEPGDTIAE